MPPPDVPSREIPRRGAALLVTLAILCLSLVYRGGSAKLTDDDFMFIARGQQLLDYGQLPTRDFADEGRPLHYVVSAIGLALTGRRLAGEILIDVALLSLGAALAARIAMLLTRSWLAGVMAGLVVTLLAPRLYNYPKVALSAAGLWLLWRYLDSPQRRSLAGLGVFAAVGFLFRYDFAVYFACAVVVGVCVLGWEEGPRILVRRLAAFGAVAVVCLFPYLVYVQASQGLVNHVAQGWRFARAEFQSDQGVPSVLREKAGTPKGPRVKVRWAGQVDDTLRVTLESRFRLVDGNHDGARTWDYLALDPSRRMLSLIVRDRRVEDTSNIDRHFFLPVGSSAEIVASLARLARVPEAMLIPWFVVSSNSAGWVYVMAFFLPVVALAIVAGPARRRLLDAGAVRTEPAKIASAVAMCLVANLVLLRGRLETNGRLSEVGAQIAIVGAWVFYQALCRNALGATRPMNRAAVRMTAGVVLAVTFVTVLEIGNSYSRLETLGVTRGSLGSEVSRRLWKEHMASPPIDGWHPANGGGLRWAAKFLANCTQPTDKVFVTWFAPQLFVYAGRGFAGGQTFVLLGFFDTVADQQLTIARLRADPPAAVVVVNDGAGPDMRRETSFERSFPLVAEEIRHVYPKSVIVPEKGPGGVALRILFREPHKIVLADTPAVCRIQR